MKWLKQMLFPRTTIHSVPLITDGLQLGRRIVSINVVGHVVDPVRLADRITQIAREQRMKPDPERWDTVS